MPPKTSIAKYFLWRRLDPDITGSGAAARHCENSMPSVIRIRQEGLKAVQLSDLIKSIWPTVQSQLEAGALVTVTEKSIRVKSIPLVKEE